MIIVLKHWTHNCKN